MQSVLILIAPALFAASIYMTLGRVIRCVHGEEKSIISPKHLTRLFVVGDVVSFFAQATGSGSSAAKNFNKDVARYITLGGLLMQIVGFGLFAATALTWHVRMRRHPTYASQADNASRWEKVLHMLYAVSLLIMIRSVFRVIEYGMGNAGYLLQHEWPLYIFDGLLVLFTVAVFACWYPGKLDHTAVANDDESDPGSETDSRNMEAAKQISRDHVHKWARWQRH